MAMRLIPAVSEDLLWRRRSSLVTAQIQTLCSASYLTIPPSPPLLIASIKTVLPIFHCLAPTHPRLSISILQMRRNRNRPSNTIAQVALDECTNLATFRNCENTLDSPMSSNIDIHLLDCLNQTIGLAMPLVNGSAFLAAPWMRTLVLWATRIPWILSLL